MKHFFLLLALAFCSACAAMQQQVVDSYCNADGAYQKGYNDGHETGRMDNSFVGMCPADQEAIRHSYRDGFDKGVALRAAEPPPPQPVEIHVVHDHGGGDDGWECRQHFGEKICGYHCVESFGEMKCAQHPGHRCIAAFGQIKCGLHCREEYGEIRCDRYE